MLAVGSEKPRGAFSGLLVRRGLIPEKTSFGATSNLLKEDAFGSHGDAGEMAAAVASASPISAS